MTGLEIVCVYISMTQIWEIAQYFDMQSGRDDVTLLLGTGLPIESVTARRPGTRRGHSNRFISRVVVLWRSLSQTTKWGTSSKRFQPLLSGRPTFPTDEYGKPEGNEPEENSRYRGYICSCYHGNSRYKTARSLGRISEVQKIRHFLWARPKIFTEYSFAVEVWVCSNLQQDFEFSLQSLLKAELEFQPKNIGLIR